MFNLEKEMQPKRAYQESQGSSTDDRKRQLYASGPKIKSKAGVKSTPYSSNNSISIPKENTIRDIDSILRK